MEISGWNKRYEERLAKQNFTIGRPTPLVETIASKLEAGAALDLACGTGRNALWLAHEGWNVTAVDCSPSAIKTLSDWAVALRLPIQANVADLKSPEFKIEKELWDFILIAYYLQRDLFERAKAGVKPGGVLLVIVHTTEGDEQPTEHRFHPGELAGFFAGWEILHTYEGKPRDPEHKRAVSEIAARKKP